MKAERIIAPGTGVYIPIELRFLRSIVREARRSTAAKLDTEDMETIAREVLWAYRQGTMGREELLRVAQRAAKRRAVEAYYDKGGFFA